MNLFQRPMPPAEVSDMSILINLDPRNGFRPDNDLAMWVRSVFVENDGPLAMGQHAHLADASIGCLWTSIELVKQGHRRIGQAEKPRPPTTADAWGKAKWEQQIHDWFGHEPTFILTFDAVWAADAEDRAFCAVVDHELSHCVQLSDIHGVPRFNKDTGKPIYGIYGHPVEEFPGVVERFGVHAAAGETIDLVINAAKPAMVTDAMIAQACGRSFQARKRA